MAAVAEGDPQPLVRLLETLLDGTRDRDDLLEQMRSFIEANEDIEDRETLLNDLPQWLDETLNALARMGMFAA